MHGFVSSFAAFTVLTLMPNLALAAWTVSDLHCHDSDCASGAVDIGFKFDSGDGVKTDCGGTYSVWKIPNGYNKCDNEDVTWKFSEGEKFGGCKAFHMVLRMEKDKLGREILVSEEEDPDYECGSPVIPPCNSNFCQVCSNNNCNFYTKEFKAEST